MVHKEKQKHKLTDSLAFVVVVCLVGYFFNADKKGF